MNNETPDTNVIPQVRAVLRQALIDELVDKRISPAVRVLKNPLLSYRC